MLQCRSSDSAWNIAYGTIQGSTASLTGDTVSTGSISLFHIMLFSFIPPELCKAGLIIPIYR